MSSTIVYAVPKDRPLVAIREISNAWGSAMRVWVSLVEKYLVAPGPDETLEMRQCEAVGRFMRESRRLWDLKNDDRLQACERAVLLWTFDWAIVRLEHAGEMAEYFAAFDSMYPVPGKANHLPAFERMYRTAADALDDDVVGLCVHQTTVSCDAWRVGNRLFDLSRDGDKSFFVFDRISTS